MANGSENLGFPRPEPLRADADEAMPQPPAGVQLIGFLNRAAGGLKPMGR
jgi:hypothetical protein